MKRRGPWTREDIANAGDGLFALRSGVKGIRAFFAELDALEMEPFNSPEILLSVAFPLALEAFDSVFISSHSNSLAGGNSVLLVRLEGLDVELFTTVLELTALGGR